MSLPILPLGHHSRVSDAQNPTILPESAEFFEAMRHGPASVADIAKSTGADKADVEATLEDFQRRQLVEYDDEASTDKTPRYRLSQLGRNTQAARWPE